MHTVAAVRRTCCVLGNILPTRALLPVLIIGTMIDEVITYFTRHNASTQPEWSSGTASANNSRIARQCDNAAASESESFLEKTWGRKWVLGRDFSAVYRRGIAAYTGETSPTSCFEQALGSRTLRYDRQRRGGAVDGGRKCQHFVVFGRHAAKSIGIQYQNQLIRVNVIASVVCTCRVARMGDRRISVDNT
jgi:hypothetical protein